MYKAEVPLYGDLVDIVQAVDSSVLAARGQRFDDIPIRHQIERHGAIRLGTQHEMRMISRLFAVMGMFPVGYYDLNMVGFPLHGTAFRPTSEESLRKNPFRVFTTVLRANQITSPSVRKTATEILSRRVLFSPRLCALIDAALSPPPSSHPATLLTAADADDLITESLSVFKWHSRATVPLATYLALQREHPMVADIVCFPSAHINHLTPRTLDIDAVQAEMVRRGLPAKDCIEGPPGGRRCEILLRQTSFKALEERVAFVSESDEESDASGKSGGGGGVVRGTHTARFGEVEQRGAAVTRKGRDLYDRLLTEAIARHAAAGKSGRVSDLLRELFSENYPDDWTELRTKGLVYFRYKAAQGELRGQAEAVLREARAPGAAVQVEQLLQAGLLTCEPITYEDFLPFSAAGIFTSNLGGEGEDGTERKFQGSGEASSRAELEELLGCTIPSEIDMYDRLQRASIRECEQALGLKAIVVAS
ncbi:hypothetical protein NEMBOFW57_009638 [Staphylotrichum longicolle]|uniref:2-oxoadipate dioxygenase/decarboxylase n=1 Tax=Staphylotrichum longicolle TaxID=669026 RepID=A0AAD4EPT4_9PEZI|nr:hypothetical protein NEMBOFW57_009638 [Staphylotrichum longicolle]